MAYVQSTITLTRVDVFFIPKVTDLESKTVINRMKISPAVMVFIIIHIISTGTGGLPMEPSPEGGFNYSISSPSSNATTAAATTSSSSSSSSKFPFLPSPDYLIRLRRNNRTSVFYAYFHSFEEEGEGAILNLNPLPLRRQQGDGASLPNHEYDDKGICTGNCTIA